MQLRRLVAAGVVAVCATLGMGGIASAAPTDPVDGGKTDASLTIHKYKTPDGGAGPNGGDGTIGSAPTGATPMGGIPFQIQKVEGINLADRNDWVEAETLVASLKAAINTSITAAEAWAPGGSYTLGSPITGSTGALGAADEGVLTFNNLPVGLYLVKELPYTGTDYDAASITKAAPFLVTVPMQNPAGTDWNYNVHVFPKNTVSSISKDVDDTTTTQVGDEIVYTITTSIPTEEITKYIVTDYLPTQAGYKRDSDLLKIVGATMTDVSLVRGTDYTVSGTATAGTVDGITGTVIFTLTSDGWSKLEAAKANDPTATLKTQLTAIVLEVGEFKNSAGFYPNDGSGEIEIKEGDKPVTKVGGQKFKKIDKDGAGLAGATFAIYKTSTPVYSSATAVPELDPLNYPRTVTSGTSPLGEFEVDGLRYSDWANNTQLTCDDNPAGTVDTGCIYYWLVETQAPNGYVKLASPVMFQVTKQADSSTVIDIENVKKDDINGTLPLTGMGGIILLVGVGGLVLAAGGYGMYRVSRKTTTA